MNPQKNILVCVTQQKTCERLIIKAAALRNEFKVKGDLYVIHVAKDGLNFLDNPREGEALQYLFEISKSVGANLSVLKSDNVIKCIADFAQEKNIGCIVLGESPQHQSENVFYKKLRNVVGEDVDIRVIP
ncbi:MAG: universal stress protein UspA [Firmicutes bacterium]|nr:universal stress protein UspA [Bacillota bacterium]